MAGHVRYTALLDACVLYPATVADALIRLSVAGLYAAKWTVTIDDEWMRGILRTRPELSDKLTRRKSLMKIAIPDWEVPEHQYECLVPCLKLPDANDIHVLAAAIAGHADCIGTRNLKYFPIDIIGRHGIEIIHPDDFIVMQLDIDAVVGLTAMKEMRSQMRNPARTAEEFAALLERSELFSTEQRIRDAAALV